MAINPLSVPNFGGPYSGGADFAPLGNLGNVYQAQQDRQRQLAALGQLGTDPTQNAMTLIKSNDPRLAQQGIELMQNITRQKYLESQQSESVRQFNLEQADRDARLKLAQEEAERSKVSGPLIWGKRKNPVTGEDEDVAYQRDKYGHFQEARPEEGARFSPPAEIAEEKRGLNKQQMQDVSVESNAALAANRAIESADKMETMAKKSFHMGKWGSESLASITQHFPEGTPGREEGINTLQMANESLRNMMDTVKASFGSRPSDKEDAWAREANAAIGADFETQRRVINRGRELAKENLKIARKRATDMRSGEFYKKGYEDPAFEPLAEPPPGTVPPPALPTGPPTAASAIPRPTPMPTAAAPAVTGGTAPVTPGTLPPGFASAGLNVDPSAISKEDVAREIARRRREGK